MLPTSVVFRCYRRPPIHIIHHTNDLYARWTGLGGAEQDRARLGMQELGWAGPGRARAYENISKTGCRHGGDSWGIRMGFAGDSEGIRVGFGGFMGIGCDMHLGICGIAGGFKRGNSPLL